MRVDFESAWVFRPDAGDIFAGGEALHGLQAASVSVGVDEELEVVPHSSRHA